MRNFLRRLAPHLIASGLAALAGAAVGGWITHDIVVRDTRTKLLTSAYSAYLSEAVVALSAAESLPPQTKLPMKDRDRLHRATSILAMSASKYVLCRATEFSFSVGLGGPEGRRRFGPLVSAMRKEIMGEKIDEPEPSQHCIDWLDK